MSDAVRQEMPGALTDPLARVLRHEERWAWPLFVASLLWIGALTLLWIDPHPSSEVRGIAGVVMASIWGWLVADFLFRCILARGALRAFLRTRTLDIAGIAIPLLRPFMILVFIWRLPVFRSSGAGRARVRYGVVTVLFAFLYVYVCAYVVWAVEKGASGANIVSFGDAIWWGFATFSTVGYGDYVPITVPGRVFAVGLMIGGLTVVAVVTATLLSALTDRIRQIAHLDDAIERDPDPDAQTSGPQPD